MATQVTGFQWANLELGHFVWDATGKPWVLTSRHPSKPGVFWALDKDGKGTVLTDPGKPVKVTVPAHDDAVSVVRDILGGEEQT